MDTEFVRRTYRSAACVTGFVLFMLASYGQFWAVVPFAGGVLLGGVLLYAMDRMVRALFTPARARVVKKTRKGGPERALLGFALVKYPLVALLIWAVTRFWSQPEVMAFAGGFILFHTVIGLRGVGRFLVDRLNETAAAAAAAPAARPTQGQRPRKMVSKEQKVA